MFECTHTQITLLFACDGAVSCYSPCFPPQMKPCEHGECTITFNDFTCSCPEEYTGKTCRTRVWCVSHPCVNGGHCVDLPEGYECKYIMHNSKTVTPKLLEGHGAKKHLLWHTDIIICLFPWKHRNQKLKVKDKHNKLMIKKITA